MALTPEQRAQRASNAARTRWSKEHNQAYYANLLEQKITEVVAKAPPLTPEQIERLRALLASSKTSEAA